MPPFFCRCYDRALGRLIARFVRHPKYGLWEPASWPDSPEDVGRAAPRRVEFIEPKKGVYRFEVDSPFDSPWPESRRLRGRAFGPADAKRAVVVMHGACDNEYTYSQWMGSAFEKAGYRVLVPAAPCHLDRRPPRTFSGAPMFWSAKLTVTGIAQWLREVDALIAQLREEGVERVGLIGYSIGSLTAGLAATLWDDLDFVCLLAPVGHHLAALPESRVARTIWPWMQDLTPEDTELMDRWAPILRRPLKAKPLFLMTLFDDLQPIALQRHWLDAWGTPPHHEYRHGHMSILFCRQLYKDLTAFAHEVGV